MVLSLITQKSSKMNIQSIRHMPYILDGVINNENLKR